MGETYSHGHHESVLRSHTWRTATNSAAYLLGHLESGQRVLDVGCGPGTITIDLAGFVAPGMVVGVDAAAEVVGRAEAQRAEAQRAEARRANVGERGDNHVRFATADTYALPFADGAFDVVHAHQVLQHLSEPVAALLEMRRVLRTNGIVAVRDGDYGGFVWAPQDRLLDRWLELYHQLTTRNNGEPNAGRHLLGWAQMAGFRDIQSSSSTWTFADPESRAWWGNLWADRVQLSAFAEQVLAYGLSDIDELRAIAGAWRLWAAKPAGWFAVLHGEVLARR
ncbi:MAG TPA: methyltransferase domain-containing protein [Acidimicrobiales bacterium]|nr:methyltransferase domain-containing protein [Acidimicrobiales bacterium]